MGEVGQPCPEYHGRSGGKGAFFIPLLRYFKAIRYDTEIPELIDKQKEEKMGVRRGETEGGDGGELMTGKL
jgi:hypothetical protein